MHNVRTTPSRVSLVLLALAGGCAATAGAEDQTPGPAMGLDEIVVTATRRQESIQAVPMSITAVTQLALEDRAATTFFDYGSSIPNLSFGYTGGGSDAGVSSSRSIAIRGIAGDGTTGFYIDDTPVPDSIDPKVMDITQIEVLRGPQGTLYGALSMGGTVRVLTQQPDTQKLAIVAHGSVSETDHASDANYQVDGALNLPLIDNRLAVRFSGIHEELGGYFKRFAQESGVTTDGVGKSTTDGGQVAAFWQITDDLSVTSRVMYQRTNLNGLPLTLARYDASSTSPIVIRPTSLTIVEPFNVAESSSDQWSLSSLDFKYHRSWGTFVFSSSYFDRRTMDVEDQTTFIAQTFGIDPIPTSIGDQNHPRVQTEELRFASSFPGPLQLISGFYYQHTNTSGVDFPDNVVPGLDAATGGALGTDFLYYAAGRAVVIETAPYMEVNYDISDHWRAIAGIRSTHIQSLTGPSYGDGIANGGPTAVALATLTNTTTTPKFALQYRITPDDQVYVTAAKGFRPGMASGGQIPVDFCGDDLAKLGIANVNGQVGPVQPDTVWSYELGEKTAWLDKRLTVNFDVFRIDWQNIQQRVLLACGFGLTANAGAARVQGGEIAISARVSEGLTLELSGGFQDAKFTETVPGVLFQSGDRVPQVPRQSVQFDADYHFPITGELTGFAHADYRYVGNSRSTNNANTDPATGRVVPLIRPAYRIADVRGGIQHGRTEYAIFIKNLTNEIANLSDTNAVAAQAVGEARVAVSPPRTLGVDSDIDTNRSAKMKLFGLRAAQYFAVLSAILLMIFSSLAAGADKARARDLGIPFDGTPGRWNSITDVPGVEVGYSTIIRGEGAHAARTGVTVIFPRGRTDYEPVFAAWAPLNGVGEMTGVGLVQEEGILEGPIATTNSLSVGTVRDALSKWMVKTWTWTEICCLPVVAETHDGYLNDISSFFVREADVFQAIQSAASGRLQEGNVGGGTGMTVYGFKGGVGTSSRVIEGVWGRYTVGVIVQANCGRREQLRIAGVEMGRELQAVDHAALDPKLDREQGSIIITIATDAPFLPHQLTRLAKRATNGLARTGSINDDLSGDIAIAFSTANRGLIGVSSSSEETLEKATVAKVDMMPGSQIDPFFAAVTEATEEALINALIAADTMTGYRGHRAEAIDHEKVRTLLRFHHMLLENIARTP